MENQLVTFETAKLAKEKGFAILWDIKEEYGWNALDCQDLFEEKWYDKNGKLHRIEYPGDEGLDSYITKDNVDTTYLAATQSLLQRWLREEYTIEVLVYKISNIKDGYTTIFCSRHYKTYEEALEEGVYEALKLIKTK